MRVTTIAIALLLGLASASAAQEWIEYQNNEDGFKVDFPGQPKITDTTWVTEQAYVLPARVYSAEMGGGKYSMTVVDYSVIERLGMERSAKCPIGAETCQGQPAGGLRIAIGPGYATQEIRDGLVFASFKYLQREGAKVTEYVWNWEDLVEGHGRLAYVRLRRDAREQAVHPGWDGPEGISRARPLSTVARVGRQGRPRSSLPGNLFERIPRPSC
jgi:hypothetical protein